VTEIAVRACLQRGCGWDERGTAHGAGRELCGPFSPVDANGAVLPDCLIHAEVEPS
jgi:hypothetical protein